MDVVGIDVSKAAFHACLLQGERRSRKCFPNGSVGYRQFDRWLKNRKCRTLHVCMEATGAYWQELARAVYEHGAVVSVVNPSRTALYARSQLRRTKTDAVDAEMIAEFCLTQRPPAWTPPCREVLDLRKLLDYRAHLVDERTRFRQIAKDLRLTGNLRHLHDEQLDTIAEMIHEIEQRMKELVSAHHSLQVAVDELMTVEGVGFITAAAFVSKLPVNRLRDQKAAAAYVGLTPRERQSGTSVRGRPRLCKTGNASLRGDLYMPALAAIRYNPILGDFARRLEAAGKTRRVIIAAVMRKLVVLAYRLIKKATAADPIAA